MAWGLICAWYCASLWHPLTILTAFVAAPITALDPITAAGWFTGIVQAYIVKPNVRDFESLADDVTSVKGLLE